jgi:integrase/recombinase XerC
MSAVTSAAQPAAPQQAVVEAAMVLLERMGLSPADLAAAPRGRPAVPTFAEYVPVVSAAVTAGTRRAYGSYWNRVVEHWGSRRLDEPTPSEIRQLMAWVKTHVVARRNARGGRSAEEHLVAALRCLYRRAVGDGLIAEADDPARKVAKPRRLPSTRRAVPEARLAEINAVAAATGDDPELDALLLRLHTETACRRGGALALRPADLDQDPVPGVAAGEGRDGALATGLPHADGPPGTARPGAACSAGRAAAALRQRAADHQPPL